MMEGWHFFPSSIQYLIAAVLALSISFRTYLRYNKSWAYRYFMGFSICIFFWCSTVFLHKNAPDAELSVFFFRLDLFFASLSNPLMFLMIVSLWKEKYIYTLSLIPPFLIALYALIVAPFSIQWSDHGWTYIMESYFTPFVFISSLGYVILSFILLAYLMKKIPVRILRKKFRIIIIGLSISNPGAMIGNYLLQVFPGSMPLGGIWVMVTFITISIAISLKEKGAKIKIEDVYSRFLSALFEAIPGKEFGRNIIEFSNYLAYTGLDKVISVHQDSFILNKADFYRIVLIDVLEKTMEFLEKCGYKNKVYGEFRDLFSSVYTFLYSDSREEIDKTFFNMIRKHEKYLLESDTLYSLGVAKFFEIVSEDATLAGKKDHEVLSGFYEKLVFALRASIRHLPQGLDVHMLTRKDPRTTNAKVIYREYNSFLYELFRNIRKTNIGFTVDLIDLTAQIIRIHNRTTQGLPVIPAFYFEELLNDLYSLFSGSRKLEPDDISSEDLYFKYLKVADNRIQFPCLDESISRTKAIDLSRIFINKIVNDFDEAALKLFLETMSRFAIPEAEVLIHPGEICIIKGNNELGFMLFNDFTGLGYHTIYIGENTGITGLRYHSALFIEKTSLLEEANTGVEVSFNNLDGLFGSIMDAIRDHAYPVIMLNGFDNLMHINSFDQVQFFLHSINKAIKELPVRFIILGRLFLINESEEQILENEYSILKKNNNFYMNRFFSLNMTMYV